MEDNPAGKGQGGKKILIIEDEEALATALKMKLTAAGFEVSVALNGQEGVDKALADKYNIILLDLILPLMDGFTVLEKLKEKGNKAPIVVLSNLSQQEDMDKAKSLGAVDYLVKSNMQLSKILEFIQNKI